MPRTNKINKTDKVKVKANKSKSSKSKASNRQSYYITRLAEDLKAFRERVQAGEKITARERRNIRARERRAMKKMQKEAAPLIAEANRVFKLMESQGINTLSQKRVYDDFAKLGRDSFTLDEVKTYSDIVAEITRAKAFLNAPDTNILTGKRSERNRKLRKVHASQLESLQSGSYVASGLIPTEEDAKVIFANYRRIEEFYAARIGKQGERGVYGSENLILYMIDVHNRGLDEYEYGLKALEEFDLESTPEFKELLRERNKVTGISGLFQKGGLFGKLAGLL